MKNYTPTTQRSTQQVSKTASTSKVMHGSNVARVDAVKHAGPVRKGNVKAAKIVTPAPSKTVC